MGGTTTGYMAARSRHRRIHWRYPRPKVYGFMPRMCFEEMRPRRRQQILEHTLLGSEIASHMSHISYMSHDSRNAGVWLVLLEGGRPVENDRDGSGCDVPG